MSKALQLSLVHAWVTAFAFYAWASFRTQLPQWTYRWRMKGYWRRFLMPLGLSNEATYLKFHQRFVVFGGVLVVFWYVVVMVRILRSS